MGILYHDGGQLERANERQSFFVQERGVAIAGVRSVPKKGTLSSHLSYQRLQAEEVTSRSQLKTSSESRWFSSRLVRFLR